MNPDLPVIYLLGNPEQHYRFLKDHEILRPGDTMIYLHEITEVRDGVNIIRNHEPWPTSAFGNTAAAPESRYHYLRPILPGDPPLPPTLKEAALPLLDYWFGKYQFTCTDDEERRVWQAVIDNLTPKEPT